MNILKIFILHITFVICLIGTADILKAQEEEPPAENTIVEHKEEKEPEDKSKNVNLDARLFYGQFNSILSNFSVTQDLDNFSYQLKSDYKKSNDYAFSNTNYFENAVEFSALADFTEEWKFAPYIDIKNDSHGMYSNTHYDREEKDLVKVRFNNEYKPTPSRWDINVGGIYYIHRLMETNSNGVEKNHFYKVDGEFGWEYGWSTSVRFKFNAKAAHYDYSTNSNNDTFINSEFIGSFKVTEFIMFGAGPVYSYNVDGGHFVAGAAKLSSIGLKYLSLELKYKYDLMPFQPEDVYTEQKYMRPNYSLSPGKIHHAECKMSFNITNKSESSVYLKSFTLRGTGIYESNNNFYNYDPYYNEVKGSDDVITANELKVISVKAKGDMNMLFAVMSGTVKLAVVYEYNYYHGSDRITYRPDHKVSGSIKIKNNKLGIEYINTYYGKMYKDPDSSDSIKRSIIGSLMLNVKMLETFYLYGKVDNIYHTKYYYRDGYPEPGRTYLGGIRIKI